ncbi:uncharacterized protein LOC110808285 [Carica papaya]|uniref:uncharacterized protein LOC110808285 n=1 Tax=Carica papaya TaxID=3649 RepID=UPI000B8D187F|nr:uncharacterized protein LOC110808285 [Carica papaya]
MEVAMEVEDDLFFADLSRRISLLIMDDDEDPVAGCPPVSFQAFSRLNHPTPPSPIFLYQQSCRRESRGTGVFIPRSSQPRRKHRQGRFNASSTKSQRPQENTRIVSQPPRSNNYFDPKKG